MTQMGSGFYGYSGTYWLELWLVYLSIVYIKCTMQSWNIETSKIPTGFNRKIYPTKCIVTEYVRLKLAAEAT